MTSQPRPGSSSAWQEGSNPARGAESLPPCPRKEGGQRAEFDIMTWMKGPGWTQADLDWRHLAVADLETIVGRSQPECRTGGNQPSQGDITRTSVTRTGAMSI